MGQVGSAKGGGCGGAKSPPSTGGCGGGCGGGKARAAAPLSSVPLVPPRGRMPSPRPSARNVTLDQDASMRGTASNGGLNGRRFTSLSAEGWA